MVGVGNPVNRWSSVRSRPDPFDAARPTGVPERACGWAPSRWHRSARAR